jgi:chromosome partitioning protein
MPVMRTLAIANLKGGVGKTAMAQTVATGLALHHRRRVLAVDVDPQGSLTAACGARPPDGRTLGDVIGAVNPGDVAVADIIMPVADGLDLVPADLDLGLANVELALVGRIGRELVLKRALAAVAERYDLAIIDTAHNLGLLTVAALAAADALLVPVIPEVQPLRGMRAFLQGVERVREAINPDLLTLGIVATFYDGRLVHHQEALDVMRAGGLPVLDVTIGRSIRVAEAAAGGESILTYEPDNPRAGEFRALVEVVNTWLENAHR